MSNHFVVDKGENGSTTVKKKSNNFAVLESILGTNLKGRGTPAASFVPQQQQQCSIGKKTSAQQQQQLVSDVLSTTSAVLSDTMSKGGSTTVSADVTGPRVRVQKKSPETKHLETFSAVGLPTWGADLKLLRQASTTQGTSAELYRNVLHTTLKKTLGTLFAEDFEIRVDEELLSSETEQFQYMLGESDRTEPKFKPITAEQLKDLPTLLKNHGSLGQWVNKVTNPDVWRVQDISNPKSFKNKAYSGSLVQVLLDLKGDEKTETQEALDGYADSIAIHGKHCVVPLLTTLRSHIETHMEFVIVANDLEFQKSQDPVYYDATHCTYESRDEDLAEMYKLRDNGFNGSLFETEIQTAAHYEKVYAELKASMETIYLLTLCASGIIQSCNLQELDQISSKLGIETDKTLYLLSKFTHEIPGLSKPDFEARGNGATASTTNLKVVNYLRGLETDETKARDKAKAILQDEVDFCEVMMLVSEIMDVYNGLSEEDSEKLNIFALPFQRQAPIVILTTLVACIYQTSKMPQHHKTSVSETLDQPLIAGAFSKFLETGEGDIENLVSGLITEKIWENVIGVITEKKKEGSSSFGRDSDDYLSKTFVEFDNWLRGAGSDFFFKDLIFSQLLDAVKILFDSDASLSMPIKMRSDELGDFDMDPITYCRKVLNVTLQKLTNPDSGSLRDDLVRLPLKSESGELNGIKTHLKVQIARLLILQFKQFCSQEQQANVMAQLRLKFAAIRRLRKSTDKLLKFKDIRVLLEDLIKSFLKSVDADPGEGSVNGIFKSLEIGQVSAQHSDIINSEQKEKDRDSGKEKDRDVVSAVRKDEPLSPELIASTRSYLIGIGVTLVSATVPVLMGTAAKKAREKATNFYNWLYPTKKEDDPSSTKGSDIFQSTGGISDPKIVSQILSDHLTQCELSYLPAKPIPGIPNGPILVPCWIPQKDIIGVQADIEPDQNGYIILPENPAYYSGTKTMLNRVYSKIENLFLHNPPIKEIDEVSQYLKTIKIGVTTLDGVADDTKFARDSILHVSKCFLEMKVFLDLLSNAKEYEPEKIGIEALDRISIFVGDKTPTVGKDYYTYLKATPGAMQSNTVDDYYQNQHATLGYHVGHASSMGISGYHYQKVPKQINEGLLKNPSSPSPDTAILTRGKKLKGDKIFKKSPLPVVAYGASLLWNVSNTVETLVHLKLNQYIPNIVAKCTGIDAEAFEAKHPNVWKKFATATKNLNSVSYQLGLAIRNVAVPLIQAGLTERALAAVGAIGSSGTPWSLVFLGVAGVLIMGQNYFINNYLEAEKGEVNKAASCYAWLQRYPLDPKLIMDFGYLACHIKSAFEGNIYGILHASYMLGFRATTFAVDWRRQKALKLAFVLKKVLNEYKKQKIEGDDKQADKPFLEIFNKELRKMETEVSGVSNPVMWYLKETVTEPLRIALTERAEQRSEKDTFKSPKQYESETDAKLLVVIKRTHRVLKEQIALLNMLYVVLDSAYIYQSDYGIRDLAEQAARVNSVLTSPADRITWNNAIGTFQNSPFEPEAGISWMVPYQTGMFVQPLVNSMSSPSGYELFNWSQMANLARLMPGTQLGFKALSSTQMLAGSVNNASHLYGLFKTWKKTSLEFATNLDKIKSVKT